MLLKESRTTVLPSQTGRKTALRLGKKRWDLGGIATFAPNCRTNCSISRGPARREPLRQRRRQCQRSATFRPECRARPPLPALPSPETPRRSGPRWQKPDRGRPKSRPSNRTPARPRPSAAGSSCHRDPDGSGGAPEGRGPDGAAFCPLPLGSMKKRKKSESGLSTMRVSLCRRPDSYACMER